MCIDVYVTQPNRLPANPTPHMGCCHDASLLLGGGAAGFREEAAAAEVALYRQVGLNKGRVGMSRIPALRSCQRTCATRCCAVPCRDAQTADRGRTALRAAAAQPADPGAAAQLNKQVRGLFPA